VAQALVHFKSGGVMKKILTFFVIALLITGCESSPTKQPQQPTVSSSSDKPGTDYPVAQTALVIGNSAYEYQQLKNPINDARAVAETLEKLGFDVTVKTDLNLQAMRGALDDFRDRLLATQKDDVGIFYYSGHGAQVEGQNYLVPIDNRRIRSEKDLKEYAVHADQEISGMMKLANAGMNIITLDACRDNPYAGSSKSLTRGLAQMPPQVKKRGSLLVAFATAPGKTASDAGPGNHGAYTYYLLDVLNKAQPTTLIDKAFSQVRDLVKQKTKQEPWLQTSLKQFCNFGGKCRLP
jgi:uncharacterized caspase-like protein